jgi:hypothetical protein
VKSGRRSSGAVRPWRLGGRRVLALLHSLGRLAGAALAGTSVPKADAAPSEREPATEGSTQGAPGVVLLTRRVLRAVPRGGSNTFRVPQAEPVPSLVAPCTGLLGNPKTPDPIQNHYQEGEVNPWL